MSSPFWANTYTEAEVPSPLDTAYGYRQKRGANSPRQIVTSPTATIAGAKAATTTEHCAPSPWQAHRRKIDQKCHLGRDNSIRPLSTASDCWSDNCRPSKARHTYRNKNPSIHLVPSPPACPSQHPARARCPFARACLAIGEQVAALQTFLRLVGHVRDIAHRPLPLGTTTTTSPSPT